MAYNLYWKCSGKIAKYDRPCPQKLMFIDEEYLLERGITLEQLQLAIEIKCPRCGKIEGGSHYR